MVKIKRHPQALTVEEGQTASFTVELEGQPDGAITFGWKRNGSTLTAPSSPFLEQSNVALANAGFYSVTVTDGSTTIESDVALLRVTAKTTGAADQWGFGRTLLLVLAVAILGLATYIWLTPRTSCSVTTTLTGPSSSTKTTTRTVKTGSAEAKARKSSRETTREKVHEEKATKGTGVAASTNGCTVPGDVAGTATIMESRNATESKELVIVLVGLAAALALVSAFYSRISKVTFPGGAVELEDFAQKTKQAVGDASTNFATLSEALAGMRKDVDSVRIDLESQKQSRGLIVEKLGLLDARIAMQQGLRREPADEDNAKDR